MDDLEYIFYFVGFAFLFGMNEAFVFWHLLFSDRSWAATIPMLIVMTIFVLYALLIIPYHLKTKRSLFLYLGCTFLIQFVEDISHWYFYGLLSGDFTFWTPILNELYKLSGLSIRNASLPLFWFIDLFVFGVCVSIYLLLDNKYSSQSNLHN